MRWFRRLRCLDSLEQRAVAVVEDALAAATVEPVQEGIELAAQDVAL